MLRIFVLVVACVGGLFAQNSLTGKITVRVSGDPVPHVHVYIADLKKGTQSDESGGFTLRDLPTGKFAVQLTRIGYRSIVKNMVIRDGINSLNVEMDISPIESEEIVITAPFSTAAEETPFGLDRLSHDQLTGNGDITLTESLQRVPGVQILSTGNGIAKPVIRGLHGNRVLTVLNGVRFDNQQWQDEHGLGLSNVGVDRVEVIKGPASAIYGSDAIGGVLHVINEKSAPIGTVQSDYSLTMNSNSFGLATDYGLRSSSDDHFWRLRLGGISHADYLAGGGKRVPNSRMNGVDVKTSYGWTRQNRITQLNYDFSYHLFGFVENEEPGKKEEEERIFARGAEEAHHSVNYHLLSVQNTFFFGSSRLNLDAGVHINNRQEVEGEEEKDIGDLNLQLNTLTSRLAYTTPMGPATDFTAGIDATLQDNSNHGKRVIIPDAMTHEISGFGYSRQLFGKLVLEESFRVGRYGVKTEKHGIQDSMGYFDAITRSYLTLNGSGGAAFSISDNWLLKANVATGYRAPNLAELTSNGLHEGTLNYEIGDKKLKIERNIEADLSASFRSNRARVSIGIFRNKINDFIYLSPGVVNDTTFGGFRRYYFLQSDATFNGAEISADITPVSWVDLRTTFATVIAKRSGGSYLPYIPANKWTGEMALKKNRLAFASDTRATLAVITSFRQSRNAPNENESPGYTLVNLTFDGSVRVFQKPARLTLGCNNLLDKKYFDHLSRIKPGAFSDPAIGFNNMGRNIYISLSIGLRDS